MTPSDDRDPIPTSRNMARFYSMDPLLARRHVLAIVLSMRIARFAEILDRCLHSSWTVAEIVGDLTQRGHLIREHGLGWRIHPRHLSKLAYLTVPGTIDRVSVHVSTEGV